MLRGFFLQRITLTDRDESGCFGMQINICREIREHTSMHCSLFLTQGSTVEKMTFSVYEGSFGADPGPGTFLGVAYQ